MDKIERNGDTIIVEVLATNTKEDRKVYFFQVEAVDENGNLIKTVLERSLTVSGKWPLNLREGVSTRFELPLLKVSPKATEFKRLDISFDDHTNGFNKREIKFKNVSLGK